MIIQDPFIFNFVFAFKLIFFQFLPFKKFTEKQELPHPPHTSIRLLLLLVSNRILV